MIEQKHFSFIEFRIIWKDELMIELDINASNGDFSGRTQVYDQPHNLFEFAEKLKDYPKDAKNLSYEIGVKNGYAYFLMSLYPIDNFGHIGVKVEVESGVASNSKEKEKNKLQMEIIVEPNAIDNFQRELSDLSKREEGTAILHGANC